MSVQGKGSWSVAVTARAPAYQVNEFLEHYVGLGADRVFLFFDDENYVDFDRDKFSGVVIPFVCTQEYWNTVYKAPPMSDRVGRPDAVEIRQGVNALFAREIMHSDWLLHVDIDEFIYVKKDVSEVLSSYPDSVFSVLLRTLEAVYPDVRSPGAETDTVYFKKSVAQKDLLRQIYSEEILQCATNGLWGTIIGKSFIRKHPEVKSMSVHWPTPVDSSLSVNVPTYYIDLLHFEGQSFDLFKEKCLLRIFKNVAKHMPGTYKVRLGICKREYEKNGDSGLLDVYKQFYVMDEETLEKAMGLGIVVKLNWSLGKVSPEKLLINNPIFDLGARISNWSGSILRTTHNTYLAVDIPSKNVVAATAVDILTKRTLSPLEVETYENSARLFCKIEEKIIGFEVIDGKLKACANPIEACLFGMHRQGAKIFLKHDSDYVSVSPAREVTVNKGKASTWEGLTVKNICPQLS